MSLEKIVELLKNRPICYDALGNKATADMFFEEVEVAVAEHKKQVQDKMQELIEVTHKDQDIPIKIGKNKIQLSQSERWAIIVFIRNLLGDYE